MDDSSHLNRRIAQLEQELNHYRQLVAAARARWTEYDAIFGLLGDFGFVYRVDADGAFVREWLSASFEQVTGYSIDQLPKIDDLLGLLHPADAERAADFKNAVLLGNPMADEFRLLDEQGET